jgi:hypothetical protein
MDMVDGLDFVSGGGWVLPNEQFFGKMGIIAAV